MSEPITHKDCGGEIVSEELVAVGYEIASDGAGGWDYIGQIAYHNPLDGGSDFMFRCGSCGWKEDHNYVVIDGSEMRDKLGEKA